MNAGEKGKVDRGRNELIKLEVKFHNGCASACLVHDHNENKTVRRIKKKKISNSNKPGTTVSEETNIRGIDRRTGN